MKKFVLDLHLHSKYSRATSPKMNLEDMAIGCKQKGVDVVTCGDFTHPAWFKEINSKLELQPNGLYKLKNSEAENFFILTTEIASIYSKNGKCRRIHNLVVIPTLEEVAEFNRVLSSIGNLLADGRPILGLDSRELAKILFSISSQAMLIPAHIWTPWFSLFGSKSGFDKIEDCFEDYTNKIFALETGLSSDPLMNWQLSDLDKFTLVSNSDAHSPQKMGREANVLAGEPSYKNIYNSLKTKKDFLYTIEFFPEEGKYHNDGHRDCDINLTPEESAKYKNVCPKCKKALVIGVRNRVNELADREYGFQPKTAVPYKSIIPLPMIISNVLGVGEGSKRVQEAYSRTISALGSEFSVLLDSPEAELLNFDKTMGSAILKVRRGEVDLTPGFDGVYGVIQISPKTNQNSQSSLF